MTISGLLVPSCAAAASVSVLCLHGALRAKHVRTFLMRRSTHGDGLDNDCVDAIADDSNGGIKKASTDGAPVIVFKLLRLLGCFTLLGLTIATLVLVEREREVVQPAPVLNNSEHEEFRNKFRVLEMSTARWSQAAMCFTYVCHVSCTVLPADQYAFSRILRFSPFLRL